MNLLLEKCGYLAENWFIWFKPACTAQSANPSSIIWFKRPDEPYCCETTLFVGSLMERPSTRGLYNSISLFTDGKI